MSAPISYTLPGAVQATGLSRSTLERAIRTGLLRAKRSGKPDSDGKPTGVYVIKADDLVAFIDAMEAA